MDDLISRRSVFFNSPWLLWISFFSTGLIFLSLWVVVNPLWHFLVVSFTLAILWLYSPNPLKTVASIIGIVGILAVLQITFSPYMRNLFFKAVEVGFVWSDWKYLLYAVERFAWPLVIVSTFRVELAKPSVIAELSQLLMPLKWIGLKIEKLQLVLILALRFIPIMRREWQRFSHFQTYFTPAYPRKKLLKKLHYGQGVLKAMLAHTIHSAVKTGDLLALRGMPKTQKESKAQYRYFAIGLWLLVGSLFYHLDMRIAIVWCGLSAWLLLVPLATSRESSI